MATEAAVAAGLATFHSWVGGREIEGRGGHRAATNPATGKPFAQASLLDAAQAGEAIAAAHAAFPAWSRTSFAERARLLDRWRQAIVDEADAIASLVEREQGKPAAEALSAEVLPSLDALRYLVRARRGPAARRARSRAASCCSRTSGAGSSTHRSASCSRSSRGTTPGASRCRCWPRRSWPATRVVLEARPGHDARRPAHRRARAEGRVPGRRRERGRRRRRGGGRARRGPAGRQDRLHRQRGDGPQGDGGGREEPDAGGARARRQGPGDRVPRRRPRPRRAAASSGPRS